MVHSFPPGPGRVLIIAGSDSSGGAGISRDIETVHAHGLMSCLAITAVTAQTKKAVFACHPIPANLVAQQIKTALSGNNIKAIKIGMLANAGIVSATASALSQSKVGSVILDPVLMSSSGTQLLDREGIEVLKDKLLPISTLLTPNLAEAAILTGTSQALDRTAIANQATILCQMGARNVLIKGGHGSNQYSDDVLLEATGEFSLFKANRISGELRGTGCALASAIAAGIASGLNVRTSCARAQKYITELFLKNQTLK